MKSAYQLCQLPRRCRVPIIQAKNRKRMAGGALLQPVTSSMAFAVLRWYLRGETFPPNLRNPVGTTMVPLYRMAKLFFFFSSVAVFADSPLERPLERPLARQRPALRPRPRRPVEPPCPPCQAKRCVSQIFYLLASRPPRNYPITIPSCHNTPLVFKALPKHPCTNLGLSTPIPIVPYSSSSSSALALPELIVLFHCILYSDIYSFFSNLQLDPLIARSNITIVDTLATRNPRHRIIRFSVSLFLRSNKNTLAILQASHAASR